MTAHHKGKMVLRQVVIAAAFLVPLCHIGNAKAEEQAGWQYDVTLYGWYAGIDTTFKSPGPLGTDDNVKVDASDILDNLKMIFMGTAEAHYNRWSIITDVIYMDVGDDATTTLVVGPEPGRAVSAYADVNLTSWVVNAGVGYDIAQADWGRLAVVGGVRYLSVDIDSTFGLGGPLTVYRSDSDHFWNGILGIRGQYNVGDKWFLPYYADIGTGDSNITWQLFGGAGYRFGWGDIMVGYRYLAFDQGNDDIVQDLKMSGPIMGAAFHF